MSQQKTTQDNFTGDLSMYITNEDVQTGNNCMKGHSLLVRGNGSQFSNEICYIVIKVAKVSPSSGNTECWWGSQGISLTAL